VASDLVDELRLRGGWARRAAFPRAVVDRALEAGLVVAPRGGIVALPELGRPMLLALAAGGVLSCGSAAAVHGLPLLDEPRDVHVTVPRERHGRIPPGVVVHRRRVVVGQSGDEMLVTDAVRTAADCARCLPFVAAVCVVDAVLARGVGSADLLDLLVGRGARGARAVVAAADGSAESSGESVARLSLRAAGVTVCPQAVIPGVGRVDLLIEGWLVVEVDGFSYHADPQRFAHDRRRDAELNRRGYRVLRFTWRDAVRRPEWLVETVLAVLSQGPVPR
jgi:very-short-patch-repair endonuclease